jgi:hypothetical protein
MSEIKTDKIIPVDAGGTSTLGCTGDTIATGAGTTLNIQGTYSGINSINWDTTAKTTNFTAETNRGYFINTTSGSVTISLPATPVAGSFIGIKDYALTAQTNNIIINPNGNKIQGSTSNFFINTQGGAANLVYVDSTQGWLTYDAAQASDVTPQALYITATGGTITTCGNYKIHTFTGPGTFCVSCAGNPTGSDKVDYLVVAGGGGGGKGEAGGGGAAGGFRESHVTATSGCYTASPLASSTSLSISATGYPITVGGGGAGSTCGSSKGVSGSSSIFSTVTSAGGGGGGSFNGSMPGASGGSGGGGAATAPSPGTGGTGNTPPVSPPQGNNGGSGSSDCASYRAGGGGGGAITTGTNGTSPSGGPGGSGTTTSISTSPTSYSGGGGAGGQISPNGSGGLGGGGAGGRACGGNFPATAGTTNTGGGGGGGGNNTYASASGGSGIVIIRYRYQ